MDKTIEINKKTKVNRDWVLSNLVNLDNPTPELRNSVSAWPKKYTSNFIEPGLVSYEEQQLGVCFVSKEALDKMAESFIGKPVVDRRNHIDGMKPKDLEKMMGGIVTKAWWSPEDNWYWCEFIVWDDALNADIEKGFSVSCAYVPTEVDNKGGVRNNLKYDQEVLNGTYTHLAIVPNPRYNGARIILNSLQGGSNMFKAFLKRLVGAEHKNAISPAGSFINVDGKKVPVTDIMNAVEEEQAEAAEKAKKEAEAKAAADAEAAKAEPQEEDLGEDSTLKIGDKEVTIKDAVNSYRNRMAKKNAAAEEEKKKADEEAKKKKEEEDAKAAEEKKNADEKAAKEKADKEAQEKVEQEKKNALDAQAKAKAEADKKHFDELKNAADSRVQEVSVSTVEEKRATGKACYGSGK